MNKQMKDYALEKLQEIMDIPSPSGYTHAVAAYLMKELEALGYSPATTVKGSVTVDIGGLGDALLLCCHVDTLGAMVLEVKSNGRLSLSPIGGMSPNNAEGENLFIHTMDGKMYTGCLQMPVASVHVNKNYETDARTFDVMEVLIDEAVHTKEDVLALGIEAGNYVSFDPRCRITESGYIKSRFLDDKLSACVLLAFAKHVKEAGISLKRRIYMHFTVHEEVGHGASAFSPPDVTEILAVDMGCVGSGLTCNEQMVSICAKDSSGPSSYEMVTKLRQVAKAEKLNYAVDVYPYYGSDADALLRTGIDARHCVIGAGVNNSHGYERSHVDGLANTYDLIVGYTSI